MNSKIIFVINSLRGGGAERVCVSLANGLVKRGFKVELVVLGLKDSIRKEELLPEIKLVDFNVHNARKSVPAFIEYIKQNRPKVILSFNREISIILIVLRMLFRFDFKLISRNINFFSLEKNHKEGLWHGVIVNYLVKKFYSLSDYIIAQSTDMGEDIKSYLKIESNKVRVINNPINGEIENYMRKIRNSTIKAKKEDYFLCVGRLEEQKAFHYTIDAFARIHKNYPTMRLKIVGKGVLKNELKEQVNRLGLEKNVDFEGFQSNTIPYFVSAKIVLLTSLYEGFPNVLVEAIALGTPVVSFDSPSGPSEIIENGVNGYLVNYQDNEHLEKCMEMALNKHWDYKKLVDSVSCYSSENILSQYEKVLRDDI